MKLIIGEEKIDYTEKITTNDVIEKINNYLAEGFYFSHFIADGTEVYEDHEEYLNSNLEKLQELEVVTKTEKEFMNDVLLSAGGYLKRAKPELVALAKAFHNNPTAKTWTNFEMLLEGAGWLNDMLSVLSESNERPSSWETYAKLAVEIQDEIAKLGKVVEEKQHGQIGNIIKGGLMPNYELLEVAIGKTIDAEGIPENLN